MSAETSVVCCGMVLVLYCLGLVLYAQACEVTDVYSSESLKNGTFHSPGWPRRYAANLQCIYRFIGRPHERVQINFTKFEVKGVPPRCTHDYIDVYTQLMSADDNLLEVPLHGRYCGSSLEDVPHLFISMYHVFIIGFYTDSEHEQKGFFGNYSFIDGSVFSVGTPAPGPGVCGQTIRSDKVSSGTLLSPTYPGMYPDEIFCFYKIHGVPGERIKLTFLDFDLYSGGAHCPFDYVRIYDGKTNQADVIGTYCGSLKGLEVFSTSESLQMEFVTASGRMEPTKKPYVTYWEISDEHSEQRRGFKVSFQISRNFVNLDFIKGGFHVRGTECDQQVLSTRESNGTIISPNFPNNYPSNVTCHYFIDGLVNKENLEKAMLMFDYIDLPDRDLNTSKCLQGQLLAYTKGQDNLRDEGPDKSFCGHVLPEPLVTADPRLLLILKAGEHSTGRGFQARYKFITDYAIEGTPATTSDFQCHFLYNSKSDKSGTFNSPRHPSNYPPSTVCIYEFFGLEDEQIRVTFANFKVEDNNQNCTTDYVRVYSISTKRNKLQREAELIGLYCGDMVPGPIVSETNSLRIELVSDDKHLSTGFRAQYEFIRQKSEKCEMEFLAGGRSGGGGSANSPNYPNKYLLNVTCEYYIGSRHENRKILLNFESFSMEGNPETTGCAQAVLKIYNDNSAIPSQELCGPRKARSLQILSQGNSIKMRFISSPGAVGAKGFTITWTEILPDTGGRCDGFQCKLSGFCIDADLRCDGRHNCGYNDTSDEGTECPSYTDHGVLHIILGVVITLVVLVFISVCVLHRRRKARKKKNKKEIEVRFVTRGSTSNKAGPDSGHLLLKERTEKVSIV